MSAEIFTLPARKPPVRLVFSAGGPRKTESDVFGVKLPLLPTDDDVGTLMDADRNPVLVVDVNRERSDEDVAWIVGMIQVAVNTCGGFKAQRREGLDE